MPKIKPYEHICIFKSGDMEGSTYGEDVHQYMDWPCDHCGEPLWNSDAVLKHIYEELTKDDQE